MPYILAIDSGNSYIKWGLSKNNHWLRQGKIFFDDVLSLEKDFINLPESTIFFISHVGREITRQHLHELLSPWSAQVIWIRASSSLCGISNNYLNPDQLGSDRWAALVAAWNIYHQACLVINVGTAVTVDALSESGKFLGGIILPGQHLMLQSLQTGTQLKNTEIGIYENFPVSTGNAVQTGVMHCLIGAIERMHQIFTQQLNQSIINSIISGGGAPSLIPLIKFPLITIDNLVLEGLVIIAKDVLQSRETLTL